MIWSVIGASLKVHRYGLKMTALVFVGTLVTVKVITWMTGRKRYRLPPGPWGLPLVGYLPFFTKEPPVHFIKLRRKYGDVFSIKMGGFQAVVVNGLDAVKEALVTKGQDFNDRPDFHSVLMAQQSGSGSVAFHNFDPLWKAHKKIVKNVLHTFTDKRTHPIEDTVQTEALAVVREFLCHGEKEFNPMDTIAMAAASIIYELLYGKSLNIREDGDFEGALRDGLEFERIETEGNPADVMPWLRFLLPDNSTALSGIFSRSNERSNRKVREHEESFDENNLRDVIDGLIDAGNKLSEQEKAVGMDKKRALGSQNTLFPAGSGTVRTTLQWFILLMAAHPHVQDRLCQEIDSVLGDSRLPTLEDRKRLPYVEATITELLRFCCPLPFALPHATHRDSSLMGYDVPAGTVVIVNLFSVMRDENLWGDPHGPFRPERFLMAVGKTDSDDGTELYDDQHVDAERVDDGASRSDSVQLDVSKTKNVITFSVGRRRCVGDFLARMELFLFVVTMMQKVRFHRPPGVAPYTLEAKCTLNRDPAPYTVCVRPRQYE